MAEWGTGKTINRWPKPTADEPPQLATAEWQDPEGHWQLLVENVPLRKAIAAARAFRGRFSDAETRVR